MAGLGQSLFEGKGNTVCRDYQSEGGGSTASSGSGRKGQDQSWRSRVL